MQGLRTPRGRAARAAQWLAGPLLLAAIPCAAFVIARGSGLLFAWAGLAVLTLLAGWIVVSALWPARVDRRCPECDAEGSQGLERADASTTCGLRCRACGWSDESASGWLLAEEDGALEDLVLAERRGQPPSTS